MRTWAAGLPINRPRAVWLVLVALVIGHVLPRAVLQRGGWFGWLPSTGAAVEEATVWGSSLIAGAAAWLAAAPRAHGYRHLVVTSVRSVGQVALPPLLFVGSAGACGYAVLAVAFVTAPAVLGEPAHGPIGTLGFSVMAVLASAVVWAAVGAVLGAHLRAPLGVITAVLVPYLVWVGPLFALAGHPLSRLNVGTTLSFSDRQPALDAWAARACLWSLLAAALVAVVAGARATARITGLAASLALSVAILGAGGLVPIPGATDPVCLGSQPVVCVTRPSAWVLPQYARASQELLAALPPAARPSVVTQAPEAVPARLAGRRLLVAGPGGIAGANVFDRRSYVSRLGDALGGGSCPTADPLQERTRNVVALWWRIVHGVPTDGSNRPGEVSLRLLASADAGLEAALDAFTRLPADQRDPWLAAAVPTLSDCSAAVPALP